MKRILGIIGTVVAIYVIAFAIAWVGTSTLAQRKTIATLRDSRETFDRVSCDSVDTVLWYAGILTLDEIGSEPKALSYKRMQELVEERHLDELNIVDSNGVIIASNRENGYGFRFADHPATAEFLKILDPKEPVSCFGQPFRPSVVEPEVSCKYYAIAFPGRCGFIQLGFSHERLLKTYLRISPNEYENWRIGRYGHFEAIDCDGDGVIDLASTLPEPLPAEGLMGREIRPDDGEVFTYTFSYAGLLYRAVVPSREFHEQRNLLLMVGGISFAILLAFLTYFVVRLSISTEKLAAFHRKAEERRASDLSLAHVIQVSSLERTDLFRVAQLDSSFDAVSYPAREVGGDFYDVFTLSDGRIVFLVADVSGKGVPAALFMHVAMNVINTAFHSTEDTAEAVMKVNDYLVGHNEAEMFVTAWFGVLNPADGEVEYVNAGHNRPYLIRADGRLERVMGKGGLFLGMYPCRAYRTNRIRLAPGDRLFLYTDGVTEAMDASRRVYGVPRLEKLLATAPENLCSAVKTDVDSFAAGAERSDDLTMFSVAWYGTPACEKRVFSVAELAQTVGFVRAGSKLRDAKQLTRLLNATDEIISNVVNYSGETSFEVSVENVPGRCRVTISDAGPEYNPLTHDDPNTHVPIADRPIGGLGILMTKKLVDSVGYRRQNGRNVLVLVQRDGDGRS